MNEAGEVEAADVKRMWESLLRDEADPDFVKTWAKRYVVTYSDEPTYRGLYRLVSGDADFAAYCDWLEVVHWYRDDPVDWNKWYFLRYAAAMGAVETARKALGAFFRAGVLSPDDPEVASYSAKVGFAD